MSVLTITKSKLGICILPVLLGNASHLSKAEVGRLTGHTVLARGTEYTIVDVAGDGAPLVGCIRTEAGSLVLETSDKSLVLRGPLAIPRIAGPNYKVWVIGAIDEDKVVAKRLGILATPQNSGCVNP